MEPFDKSFVLVEFLDFDPVLRIDVLLSSDINDLIHHHIRGLISVHPCKGRVYMEVPSPGRYLEYAFDGIVEDGTVSFSNLA
ncbi:MAG: hypothetical protein A4E58_01833 [Syntrophorhabdus sp. PtaB.Bin006]|nr:MAG: hypothetical protein A4E58_01833 [Syntrophorhabdus sp. PtaB.Bin006]